MKVVSILSLYDSIIAVIGQRNSAIFLFSHTPFISVLHFGIRTEEKEIIAIARMEVTARGWRKPGTINQASSFPLIANASEKQRCN